MAAAAPASRPMSIGAAILDQIVKMDARNLSAATARELLKIGFKPADHARIKTLTMKAQEGRISGAEQHELDEYLHVADVVAILHSKARQAPKRAGEEP